MKNKQHNMLTIFKKEMHRFFYDKRMILTMILPGLLIFLIYSLLGNVMQENLGPDKDHVYTIQAENMSEQVKAIMDSSEISVQYVEKENPMEEIKGENLDLYIIFPENFDLDIQVQKPLGSEVPQVKIYYNSSDKNSANIYAVVSEILNGYESALANRFDVNNPISGEKFDLATSKDFTKMFLSTLMPMLLMVMIFSGCMSIVPESIAGEKERGTIATLLVTPMSRSSLAIGKISALSCIALLSGLCSFLGVMFALPSLTGGAGEMMDASIYHFMDYFWILLVILSSVLLFTSLISVVSAWAHSVKEAMSYVSPLMIIITLMGISGMFSEGAKINVFLYLIPCFGSVNALSGIFSLNYVPLEMIFTVVSNLLFTGLLVFLLTRMFNSEKVMFKK